MWFIHNERLVSFEGIREVPKCRSARKPRRKEDLRVSAICRRGPLRVPCSAQRSPSLMPSWTASLFARQLLIISKKSLRVSCELSARPHRNLISHILHVLLGSLKYAGGNCDEFLNSKKKRRSLTSANYLECPQFWHHVVNIASKKYFPRVSETFLKSQKIQRSNHSVTWY